MNRSGAGSSRGARMLACGMLLALLTGVPVTARPLPDDLALDRPWAALGREPPPNPHGAIACERCHTRREASYELARQFGLRMPLATEAARESSSLVCEQCHATPHVFHPVDIVVRRLADAVERAAVFPLETHVEGYTKLTCISCHDVHFPNTVNRLLRGFSVAGRAGGEGAPFGSRLDFCRSCHGAEETAALSGHGPPAGDRGCSFCHYPRRGEAPTGILKRGLNAACSVCHPEFRGLPPHYGAYNPFPGVQREAAAGSGIELVDGHYTCATCHVQHRASPAAPFLKPGFLKAVATSILLNPHRSTRFCLSCHPGTPPVPPGTSGASAALLVADVTRLCQGCHMQEGALRMHHPLAAPTAGVGVPAGWPLQADGTLGCQTCHLPGHAPRNPENPRLLRGGPYGTRSAPCLQCHRDELKRKRDLHREVGKGGGCDFCHAEAPASEEARRAKRSEREQRGGPLRADPTVLCLFCHGPLPHPASADHTVKPRQTSFLTIDRKLAPLTLGKVTCHSCHDSHSAATKDHLLRRERGAICESCHPY